MKATTGLIAVLTRTLAAVLLLSSFAGALPAAAAPAAAAGTIYYVDSVAGSDANGGTDPGAPWATLAHVYANASLYEPGDQILLKSGSEWNEQLDVAFSGSADQPITIGKYGGEAKPVINGGGRSGGYAVRIQNQQNITVRDIEITNYNPLDYDDYKSAYYRRSGVWIQAFHNGVMSNISLIGLDIHDVTGISVTGESSVQDTDGNWVNKNSNAAIMVNAWEWDQDVPADRKAYFDNLTIEDCSIHDIRTIGISVDGHPNQAIGSTYHKNVVISNNVIDKTGSDAIIVGVSENPLIEYNAAYDVGIHSVDGKWIAGIWVWRTDGATVQNNEVARVHYQNSANTDSNAFDVDILTEGVHVFQYNYSHDNAGGFTMDMGQLRNGINIFRYNISENDAHHGFSGNTMNIKDPSIYYNNVFYNDNGDGFRINDNAKATFINNVFYTAKGNDPFPTGPRFYNNDFFGSAPPVQGVSNMTVDPKFVNPGQGQDGIDTVAGYMLRPDSPLIGAGRVVDANGGKDFWGNPLYQGSPDIGAFEDPGSDIGDTSPPAKPTGVAVTNKSDTSVTLSWNAAENGNDLDGDVYDAGSDNIVASVLASNSVTLTGLMPDTEYSYYVIAKDSSGNVSPKSESVSVRTSIASVIVDNAEAVKTGSWNDASGNSSYQNDYWTSAKGDGSNSVTWTPGLPVDGYYSVYYHLPNVSGNQATNAPFIVQFDGGSKRYSANVRSAARGWVLLGTHKFKAGSEGSVVLTNNANGEVAADAVKFLYRDGLGPSSIDRVVLTADKLQVRLGETIGLTAMGTDAAGNGIDLLSEGYAVSFHVDSASASVSSEGVVTGVSTGTANITATVELNGTTYSSNVARVVVGPGFTVEQPAITDINGDAFASFTPFGFVQALTTAINSTDKQQNVTLIVAVYNQKGLVKLSSSNVIIKSYENASLKTSLVLPPDVKGCYLKVFVWDSKDAMHPLAERTVVSN